MDEVSKSFPDESRLIVENVVANAVRKAALSENVPLNEFECTRDYGRACPEGWFQNVGSYCKAPISYNGQCQSLMDFGNMTPTQKGAQAAFCGTQFPCVDTCDEDFVQTCPHGWRFLNDQCVAPASYPGFCVGRKNMDQYNVEDKKYWARMCHVHWPCLTHSHLSLGISQVKTDASTKCVWDSTAVCPSEWQIFGKRCAAPHGYKGACARFMHKGPYSRNQMQALSVNCGFVWPCQQKVV